MPSAGSLFGDECFNEMPHEGVEGEDTDWLNKLDLDPYIEVS